ncbi:MAG: class I SAM-dependent methyltransferase [Nanoarchaeota archaeon]
MAQYDQIASKYLSERKNKKLFNYNNFIEIPNMIKFVGNIKDKRILDLGCGFGDHAKKYIENGAKEVIGLDISKELIKMTKNRNIERTSFKVCDLNNKLPFPKDSFDIITSSLTISYIKNLDGLFREVSRVLKNNGLFIFSTGNPVFDSAIKRKVEGKYEYILGVKKISEFKREIYGNYFDESLRETDLGKGKLVKLYPRTYETIIKMFLKNNFELVDYLDARPIKYSKKINPSKYELTSKMPTFCFFKLKLKALSSKAN